MPKPSLWKSIVRYLTGEASRSDAEQVRSWAEEDPDHQELLSSLEEMWDDARHRSDPAETAAGWDADAGWATFEERRRQAPRPSSTPALRLEPIRRSRRWAGRGFAALRAAAAVVLVLGAGVLGSRLYRQLSPLTGELQTFSTETGQRATLRLGDGTEASLGPASQIVLAPAFRSGAQREIRLTGVAYFDVAPNPDRPFIVVADETRTEVVGTQFGVRAYPDEDVVQVVVAEGEVRFSRDSTPSEEAVALEPGSRATLFRTESSIVTDRVDPERALAWRTGRLAFDDQPLTDVVSELTRWFALDFRIADAETGARRFTGTFRTESVRDIVEILMAALEISYTRQGQVIMFQPAPSPNDGRYNPIP